jgi:magnesium chelatase family protein
VTIARAAMSLSFPARFMLAAAMNPCPCGYFNDKSRECMCTPPMIQRYVSKVSGPLLDRIDIHIEVPAVQYKELRGGSGGGVGGDSGRVLAARERQHDRFAAGRERTKGRRQRGFAADLCECADEYAADPGTASCRRMRSGCWSGRCSSRG